MADLKETGRMEAFSDGVFAIAITLLVLEIKVPDTHNVHSPADLWHALVQLWPSYFAFAYSFGVIMLAWVNHHKAFNVIERISEPFIYANGFLLLTITFIPFPTALLATYINTPYAQPAIVFYCFTAIINSIGWNLFTELSLRPQNLVTEAGLPVMKNGYLPWVRMGLLIYTLTFILSIWLPITALCINVSVYFMWLFLSLLAKVKRKEEKKVVVETPAE